MFTAEQMEERLDLIPVFNGDLAVLYVREDHPEFCGDHEMMFHGLRKTQDLDQVFQLCKASKKRGAEEIYFPITDFRETNNGWETSLHEALLADRRQVSQEFREKNLPFLRMYSTGDSTSLIHCSFTGQQLDSWEMVPGKPINIWEQHHFKVFKGTSVQKESADPGEILRRMDFGQPAGNTLEAIKDMMRTIFLSPTAHKAVHNTWAVSDVRMYAPTQLPWALRNQQNWDEWISFLETQGYNPAYFGSFEDWIASLTHDD